MRGYSKMSDEDRQSILKQHATVYDGYATGNVQSNMNALLNYDEDLQHKRDQIEENVNKSLDMFRRFKGFN